MRSELLKTLQDRATRFAPIAARAYYLTGISGRFPSEGAWGLHPFFPPDQTIPTGTYRIGFMSAPEGGQQVDSILGGGPPPTIEIYEPKKDGSQSLAISKSAKDGPHQDPLLQDPRHIDDLINYRREKLSAKLVENEQLLSKRLTTNREQAEQLLLNRAYRQEMTSMLADQHALSQNCVAMANSQMKSSTQLIDMANEVVSKAKDNLASPPPAPVSHIPMMITAGVELIVAALTGRRRKGRGETPIDAIVGGQDDEDPIQAKTRKAKEKNAVLRARVEAAEAKQARKPKKSKPTTKKAPKKPSSTSKKKSAPKSKKKSAPKSKKSAPKSKRTSPPRQKPKGTSTRAPQKKPEKKAARKPQLLTSGRSK